VRHDDDVEGGADDTALEEMLDGGVDETAEVAEVGTDAGTELTGAADEVGGGLTRALVTSTT
jgi:hypothetical protein